MPNRSYQKEKFQAQVDDTVPGKPAGEVPNVNDTIWETYPNSSMDQDPDTELVKLQ